MITMGAIRRLFFPDEDLAISITLTSILEPVGITSLIYVHNCNFMEFKLNIL